MEVSPADVIVVANKSDPDSLALAQHYIKARDIPAENLIALQTANTEEISWKEFTDQLWNPLLLTLHEKNWLKGTLAADSDSGGRRRINCKENNVGYLVLCRGIPLRVKNNPDLVRREQEAGLAGKNSQANLTTASVDSELTLLAAATSSAAGPTPNQLFSYPRSIHAVRRLLVITARLDGPTLKQSLALVDNALTAEKNGLAGRAYIDLGGPHPPGNKWLGDGADMLEKTGFDIARETTPALFDFDARTDAVAFYFGWYAEHASGRFADPALHFVPGAIAMHLHSYSASTLRTSTRHWVGPLLARGATLTFGNVAEPYLLLTTRPDYFIRALLNGAQAGEAYAISTPAWSWQTILVGDPLYRPFKVSIAKQLEQTEKNTLSTAADSVWRDGVLLRQANLLNAKGERAAANALLAVAVRKQPTPALLLALARSASHPILAAKVADFPGDQVDPGLLLEAARYLTKESIFVEATAIYKKLLDDCPNLPDHCRKKIASEATIAAEKAGLPMLARLWRKE